MFRIEMRKGKDGRWRWFALRKNGRINYSSFPRSFASNQEAWEHAEWACGASVTMVYEHPEARVYQLRSRKGVFKCPAYAASIKKPVPTFADGRK